MKKSKFYIGNIVKKSYKTYKEPIVFMLSGTSDNIQTEEQIVKENALLFRSKNGFVDVEDMKNNFDLICEYIMKRYMGMDYFDYLKTFSYDLETPYVDRNSLTSYYPEEEKNERTSVGKVRRLAFKDPRINIQEKDL